MKTAKNTNRSTSNTRKTARRPQLNAELLGDRVMPAVGILAVGTDVGVEASVRTYIDTDANGTYETMADEFSPFGGFAGGVRVATGDFNGDGNAELVTATGTGGGRVKVWALNSDGSVGGLIDSFLPFGAGYAGGLFVAAGDTDNDGKDELAVSRGSGGNTVKMFSDTNSNGKISDNQTDAFNPFGAFAGGTRVAFGNTNNLGGDELIVGKGPGADPLVAIYSDADADRAMSDNPVLESFLAYGAGFTGGVYVASGNISGAGGAGAELIVGKGEGTKANVKIFSDSTADGLLGADPLFDAFQAYGNGFIGGARVAVGDTDLSGSLVEVITAGGAGGGGGGRVTIRDDGADAGVLLSDEPPADSSQPFGPGYSNGMFVAFGKVRTETYGYQGNPVAIPDTSTTTSTISVPAGAGKIKDLMVDIALMHTFNDDLDVTLTHVPTGTTISLFHDVGGSADGFIIRLSDAGATGIQAVAGVAGAAISGTYSPDGALSAFDGEDASGDWILTITDDAGPDSGTLFNWGLKFTY